MKLNYFDIYGRAEAIRLALTYKKVEFEDNRIDGAKWAELKPQAEFGQVPLFEHDGKKLVQSIAILRYIGRLYDMYPNEVDVAYQIDSGLDAVEDYLRSYLKFHFEKEEERKKQFKEDFLKFAENWFAIINKRLAGPDQKFIAGDRATILDMALFSLATIFYLNEASPVNAEIKPLVDSQANLKGYFQYWQEEFKDYLAARPQPRPI